MTEQYISISVFNADPSKLSFGYDPRVKKSGEYAILYDGKIPTFTFDDGVHGKDKFMLESFNGPVKNKVWNAALRKFTEEWDGTYGINFKLAQKYNALSDKEKKMKDFMDAIMACVNESSLLQEIHGEFKCELMYQPTYIKKEIQGRMQKTKVIDQEKAIYMNVKLSYSAPEDAPTEKGKTGKDEPVKDCRFMSTPFYHPRLGQADPQGILGKQMKCLPEVYLSYSCVNSKHYISMRMDQCYYVLVSRRTKGPNASILSMISDMVEDEDPDLQQS